MSKHIGRKCVENTYMLYIGNIDRFMKGMNIYKRDSELKQEFMHIFKQVSVSTGLSLKMTGTGFGLHGFN